MLHKWRLFIYLLIFTGLFHSAQERLTDSLKQELRKATNDTIRCGILYVLAEKTSDEEWPAFNEQLLKLSEKRLKDTDKNTREYSVFLAYYASALGNVAFLLDRKGDVPGSAQYYLKSLQMHEQAGNKTGVVFNLNSLGSVFYKQGDVPKALEYYGKSLKIGEEIGDKSGTAYSMINLGVIYNEQGDNSKAIDLYNKALKLLEELGDRRGTALALNNIGYIYNNMKEETQAEDYFKRSLKIKEELGDKVAIANAYLNIGAIRSKQGDIAKALEYFTKSLELNTEMKDKHGIANSLNYLGGAYLKQKDYKKALEFSWNSMKVAEELGYPDIIGKTAKQLNDIYRAMGNYQLALENYELYIRMRDSISSENNRKASVRSQLKHEYEKMAAADSVAHAKETEIKNAELKKQEAEIRAKKNQQYALFGGLALVMVFAGFMFNRFKGTQKQKQIIELQKAEVENQKLLVEHKQKEILDSIRYAKRIQQAQLPSESRVKSSLSRLKN